MKLLTEDGIRQTEREQAYEFVRAKTLQPMEMEKIEGFIDRISCISDLQREFYKQYLNARYELIIRPEYELASTE